MKRQDVYLSSLHALIEELEALNHEDASLLEGYEDDIEYLWQAAARLYQHLHFLSDGSTPLLPETRHQV